MDNTLHKLVSMPVSWWPNQIAENVKKVKKKKLLSEYNGLHSKFDYMLEYGYHKHLRSYIACVVAFLRASKTEHTIRREGTADSIYISISNFANL